MEGTVKSLVAGMKIINDSVPKMLQDVSISKKLPSLGRGKKEKQRFEKINFKRAGSDVEVVLKSGDKERFLKELDISEQFVKKLRKKQFEKQETYGEFKASRGYLKLANSFFLKSAGKSIRKGYFKSLSGSLRKANIDILFESYVALIYLSVLLSFIASIFITVVLLFFSTMPIWPFFEVNDGGYLLRIGKIFWIPVAVPLLTFLGLYIYPLTEKKSIGNKINQELPFAVIHMSAISGSGIEPSEIFRIIGLNKEYPYLRREIRKVLNQINLYGYDLTTALSNAAKSSPSEKLSELFSGLSTTITSGADLSEFFEKRAETLLLGYRIEREKYTQLVETFLDIYISVVIAAPMIFLLLLVMMAVSGMGVALSSFQISVLAVLIIAVLNIVFLLFLQMKQPSY
ncbi:MAG: type II secretion system F family protein [Nanoarchaeota archaeon]|nr:type II secretion system F family protein [Nanoarchaeota archaeon]